MCQAHREDRLLLPTPAVVGAGLLIGQIVVDVVFVFDPPAMALEMPPGALVNSHESKKRYCGLLWPTPFLRGEHKQRMPAALRR